MRNLLSISMKWKLVRIIWERNGPEWRFLYLLPLKYLGDENKDEAKEATTDEKDESISYVKPQCV